jgi:hypothetical protein
MYGTNVDYLACNQYRARLSIKHNFWSPTFTSVTHNNSTPVLAATTRFHYQNRPVNAVEGYKHYLLPEPYKSTGLNTFWRSNALFFYISEPVYNYCYALSDCIEKFRLNIEKKKTLLGEA